MSEIQTDPQIERELKAAAKRLNRYYSTHPLGEGNADLPLNKNMF